METLLKNLFLFIFATACVFMGMFIVPWVRIFSKTKEESENYFLKLAVNMDYVGGTLLYDTDAKTVSAVTGKRSYEEARFTRFERFINWLFSDDKHCYDAYQKEFPK